MSFDFIMDKDKKVYFIGIGGISMSGLAEILIERNFKVSGSDMNSSSITDRLAAKGVQINIGQSKDNITNDIDLVIYTAAISDENPELLRTKELNIPTMTRAEFLGYIMKGHKYNVAVAGTHGKTTTTSMISHICLDASLDPTILVGGQLDIINGNVRPGNSDYFITEACEYKGSFLKFFPYVGVILNIDADHLDYYKDINEIQDAFINFTKLIPEDGYLVCFAEDEKMDKIISEAKCNILTYGINTGNITAQNISFNEKGCASFDAYNENEKIMSVQLNVPGKHNLLNALASICTGISLNVPKDKIVEGLKNFKGTHRRFELKGVKNNVTVIDDYAHHPTEIKATLSATKNYPHRKIFCVFQPHTYSRTISLFNEFVEAFDDADEILLADIYAAREQDTGIVNSTMLGDKIRERGLKCSNFHDFNEAVSYLNENLEDGDIFLTVGAGDVYKIGEMYLKENN
ncbi:UDP-N-acetylmuramate--L-alanine ligase [Clostridium magnum]|uniref:UDP-N-acetylmuramate--L-alanine ligase n=1 Tax=Clostridium magnum DSM 2767 TaxID=1121326 RepID=A0A162TV71_9CLOT|nr:UDP-N-acetylmuramate--L-alanine ligase [Clostridium magnum]KZL93105.1 UDP-N-acetylmuramate--L-alanine ligase [Clostridium magnum DSM 2767]SHI74433.1 UDP-N-acetylmuramate--L-alanine ligase [Clostridium magnum DSM 2767]